MATADGVGSIAAERRMCRTFGVPKGTVIYATGVNNLGVYCQARRNDRRYGVIGHRSVAAARRAARVLCRDWAAGAVRVGNIVVVSPERGFYKMGWVARRVGGRVICNG